MFWKNKSIEFNLNAEWEMAKNFAIYLVRKACKL